MSLLAQILMQLPAVLIALTGFVLAAIFMGRARTSAILVIIASILTLLQSGFTVFNHVVMLERVMNGELDSDTYSIIGSAIFTLFYIAISVLLLAAAFAGRNPQPEIHANTQSSTADDAPAAPLHPHRGALILTLGLLGLLMFAPLGIAAWIMGNKDLAAMREGTMDKQGEGQTLAGKVLGILATALMIFGIIVFFAAIAILTSNYRGF